MLFEFELQTLQLQYPAQFPYSQATELVQARERSATGVVQVESFDVKIGRYTFNFKNMPNDDYLNLLEWFVNVVNGMYSAFYLTDDLGIRRLVRFTTATLSFKMGTYNLWNGSFTVEEVE